MKFFNKKVEEVDDEKRVNKISFNQKMLWCPFAEIPTQRMQTKGKYEKNYPTGAVIHYTASANDPSAVLNWGREMGYCYFLIDREGKIYQSFPLDEWGSHAGESEWLTLKGVSKHFVGIEVMSAGRVTKEISKEVGVPSKFAAWFHYVSGTKILKDKAKLFFPDEVREVKNNCNIQAGVYHKFLDIQEESLINLLMWLKMNNSDVFSFSNVIGHDECAPLRKQDPGGSLSMTMNALRNKLYGMFDKKIIG